MADTDPHLDALADAIMQHLNGPAPTAPTPPSFQGLSPLAAAAGAMNPQAIPLLMQKQMGPAQAQYQQQQAAFEQAMLGRREALQAGTALAGQQSRAEQSAAALAQRQGQADIQAQLRALGIENAQGRLEEQARHNAAMEAVSRNRQETYGWYPDFDTKGNRVLVNKLTGEIKRLDSSIGKPPTTADTEAIQAQATIEQQLDDFSSAASRYASDDNVLGYARAMGQAGVRKLPLVGQELSEGLGDSDFERLSAMRDRIGAQLARLTDSGRLSDQDLDFALQNLPSVASLKTENGRTTAAGKIATVKREIGLRLAARKRLRPGLYGGVPEEEQPAAGPYSGKSLPQAQFNQLKPSEQKRWMDGGGTVR